MIFANRIANGIANRTLTMIGDFIFSWAENAEGRMVHVDSVPRGLRCGCTCPNCHEPLLARHGEKNEHGFAHHSDTRGANLNICCMVILYKLAEQIIQTKNPNGTGQCPAEKPRLARSVRKMGRTLTCPLSRPSARRS